MRRSGVRVIVASLSFALFGLAAHAVDEVVLWNKLGSDTEVLNSEIGPDLSFWNTGDPDPNGGGVPGARSYPPGQHGTGMMIEGTYGSTARVHNLLLGPLETVIDPEKGCIEIWYRQTKPPVAYVNGVYRLFDGSFGLKSPVQLGVAPDMLYFYWLGSPASLVSADPSLLTDDTWFHIAATWDRTGLDGSAETMRIYLDGAQVAGGTTNDWVTSVAGSYADIGGGQDNIGGSFAIDNLKVCNFGKTDFGDRFTEGPTAVPIGSALSIALLGAFLVLLLAAVIALRRVRI